MSKKRVAILILAIAFILIGIGIIFVNQEEPAKAPVESTSEEVDESIETRELELERCYQNLCVSKLTIEHSGNNNNGTINFTIRNKGIETVEEGILVITFDNDDSRNFFYNTLNANESIDVRVSYDGEELKDVNDYTIGLFEE